MILTRDAILAVDDLKRVQVGVPEWGGSVFVKTMTGTERDSFESDHLKDPTHNVRARLAAFTVCDDSGKLLFSVDDISQLGSKHSAPLDRIFAEAVRLNKIGKQDIEELGNACEPTH